MIQTLARCLLLGAAWLAALDAAGQTRGPKPMLEENVDRPLRYTPVDTGFVITNGGEFFNRPLYGHHDAFRVDAGDLPEFSLYLPGRGGNLRLGLQTAAGVKWLHQFKEIVARYRPGSMLYELRDPLAGDGELRLTVLPLADTDGVIMRAEMDSPKLPVQLVWAFGGANGMTGRRGGDIGCEREPVGKFFQLKPDQCRGEMFTVDHNSFVLHSKVATLRGLGTRTTTIGIADARFWNNANQLLASAGKATDEPVVIGHVALPEKQAVYFSIEAKAPGEHGADEVLLTQADQLLPHLFAEAEAHRQSVAECVVVETPDPFINAAVPALNIAADAVWDDQQQSFMHGAVAWRQRLLGWRGLYAGDELGRPERTAKHFAGYARQQNTNPVPAVIPAPEESANLSRNENALHSNGDLTKTHYDMNLVAVDGFFRHLLWTGDLDYAREMWPVIKRHLAWEQRLFRREFGPDQLPLYEGYAAIWASDDLAYNGGGATHASAYNYFENQMAARVAKLIGEDPAPYAQEANLISRAMQKYLWQPDEGNFAESKDYLGLQRVHPNAGLWTFYQAVDSGVPTPEEAWRMTRWVDTHIAHIPIRGKNVPDENLFTLPTTSWLPYQWSLNNVVVAENMHTSLAFWLANRPEAAFALFKGAVLDTMFLGLCPGNVGAMTSHDMARGEAQRDFGDGIGTTSRALVEGLFGVRPDVLAGELKIVPGFPDAWNFARIHHPDFNFEFQRTGAVGTFQEEYLIEPKFPRPVTLDLEICALATAPEVTINEKPVEWSWVKDIFGVQRILIQAPAAGKFAIKINWKGGIPRAIVPPEIPSPAPEKIPAMDWNRKCPAGETFETVNLVPFFNARVTQIFRNEYRSPRSLFASLAVPQQGIGSWCHPNDTFDVDDSGLRSLAAKAGGKITLPDGVPFATPGAAEAKNIAFVSQWDNYPRALSVPITGRSAHAFLLMAGSTSAMQSRFDNGEIVVTYADGTTAHLALRNPTTWWPIDQDYLIDDYAFSRPEPLPVRVDLKTGKIRVLQMANFKGRGGIIPGGAATVLDLPLDAGKDLKSLTVRALANEVVIGLMSATLERPAKVAK